MKEVIVKSPGSCGEFIQGIYKDNPCLVSCPIDIYSTIKIKERAPRHLISPKSNKMLDLFFNDYGIPASEKKHIDLELFSDIPIEKGMASSTADIAGVAMGLASYFGIPLTPYNIADLCIRVEPTDNIMFTKLNLYNHISGAILKEYHKSISASIFIVEFKGKINTINFHNGQASYNEKDCLNFEKIQKNFEKGIETDNLSIIGESCTESARLNQKILFKPYLEPLVALCKSYGGKGVVTGHSGTIIGIVYEEATFNYPEFMREFVNCVPKSAYDALYLKNTISGGLQVTIKEIKEKE